MLSCEFCEISKNIFFTEHSWWLLLIGDLGNAVLQINAFHVNAPISQAVERRCFLKKVFYEKGVLQNFAIFTEMHLCQSLFFIQKENLTQVLSR